MNNGVYGAVEKLLHRARMRLVHAQGCEKFGDWVVFRMENVACPQDFFAPRTFSKAPICLFPVEKVMQKAGEGSLIQFLFGNINHGLTEAVVGKVNGYAIYVEEYDGAEEAGSFVAIQERLVFGDVKSISRRHFKRLS